MGWIVTLLRRKTGVSRAGAGLIAVLAVAAFPGIAVALFWNVWFGLLLWGFVTAIFGLIVLGGEA